MATYPLSLFPLIATYVAWGHFARGCPLQGSLEGAFIGDASFENVLIGDALLEDALLSHFVWGLP